MARKPRALADHEILAVWNAADGRGAFGNITGFSCSPVHAAARSPSFLAIESCPIACCYRRRTPRWARSTKYLRPI